MSCKNTKWRKRASSREPESQVGRLEENRKGCRGPKKKNIALECLALCIKKKELGLSCGSPYRLALPPPRQQE